MNGDKTMTNHRTRLIGFASIAAVIGIGEGEAFAATNHGAFTAQSAQLCVGVHRDFDANGSLNGSNEASTSGISLCATSIPAPLPPSARWTWSMAWPPR